MTVTNTPTGQDLICLVCGTAKDIDIDHVQAKGMGGSKERDVPENKTPLCRPCHDAKHRHVLETRVKDGVFEWHKRGGGVWIKVPVEVSQRYKCWVQKEVMPDGVPDTAMREMRNKPLSDGQRVEEGEEAGRLSAAAEGEQSAESVIAPSAAAPSAGLTHERRVAIAQEIKDAEWNRQWIAGDTGNAWIAELGEEAEQYLSDFGYVHESLANILYVCEAIPKNMRRSGLRFSHHVVMLGLNREDMEMWLDKCEEKGWSVAEFRRQVKGTKPKVKRWSRPELQERWDGFWAVREQENPEWDFGTFRHVAFAKFLDWLSAEEQA